SQPGARPAEDRARPPPALRSGRTAARLARPVRRGREGRRRRARRRAALRPRHGPRAVRAAEPRPGKRAVAHRRAVGFGRRTRRAAPAAGCDHRGAADGARRAPREGGQPPIRAGRGLRVAQLAVDGAAPRGLPPAGWAMTPRVSVIVTCHDLGEYLDDAVDSVLAQTMGDAEILITDD